MNLENRIEWLKSQGCHPSVYKRGSVWRAHVNAAGNFWEDAETPEEALELAVQEWEDNGRPMEGMASSDDMGSDLE